MKKLTTFFSIASVLVISLTTLFIPSAHAAFNQNDLIDDTIYSNASSMNAGQIDNWLNTNFGSGSCISTSHGFSSPDPTGYSPGGGFTYGNRVSAGQVIFDAAQAYSINPEVLLSTLQKEQSLVTGGGGCGTLAYTGAMGYGCPDSGTTHSYSGINLYFINGVGITSVSGTCVSSLSEAGFSEQVIHGAWLLKFGQQRAEGNTGWDVQLNNYPQSGDHWDNSDDPQTCYGGPMTQGSFKRCSTDANTVFYDGFTTIDGTSVHMDDGATAALYWYTPHFSGNQHFYSIFSGWFGDPNSACSGGANVSGAPSGSKVLAYQYNGGGPTSLALTELNNTGSTCAEAHVWNGGYQSWQAHIATGMRATDPSGGMLVANNKTARIPAGITGLTYVTYSGSGGTVEVHKFSPNLQTFPGYYDVATNLGDVSPTAGTFVSGDFFGRGYDQLAYVLYSGGGGFAEIHMFDPSLRTAIGYYDVPTNLSGVSATSGTFVAGDFLGRGYDQLAYVLYSGGGGTVEVHLFDPTLRKAIGYYDVATNLGSVSPNSGTFVAGDFLGRGYDQLAYVLYSGSGGKVEVHTFSPDLRRAIGFQDISTNLPSFDPTQ